MPGHKEFVLGDNSHGKGRVRLLKVRESECVCGRAVGVLTGKVSLYCWC